MTITRRTSVALLAVLAVGPAACSSGSSTTTETSTTETASTAGSAPAAPITTVPATTAATTPTTVAVTSTSEAEPVGPQPPPVNPFLAESAVPIPHGNAAQTDSVTIPGPTGPTRTLTAAELTYTHLGPAHFGIAISPPYPDGRRVIWSNGGDRISKLDYDTLDVLAELPLAGKTVMTPEQADAEIAQLDGANGIDLANVGIVLAAQNLTGIAGVYYVLDVDNTLFVGGTDSILAYHDADPNDSASPIVLRDEWTRPAEIGGKFVGANMTFDGRLVAATDEGWVVVVSRDFTSYEAIRMVGAEAAAQHNADAAARGARSGAADWVRNSIAVDDNGGIYVASFDQMHKVVWTGTALSTDEADGAWAEPYLAGVNGTGATPTLMGFGDEDRFVTITDGEALMNVVLFWRDEIPVGWEQPAGAPSRRIAGQQPADIGDPARPTSQTEQSVVVGGYGALVVNNDPASIPEGFPAAGTRVLAGYAGADPAFTPHGIQKFEWDPASKTFAQAWVNDDASSANAVPIVSTGSNLVYTVGARDGQWTLEGVDWLTGASAFHLVTGSNRYNSLFSGINLDQEGRIVHTTSYGIVRYL